MGEGLRLAGHKFVVARRGGDAPLLGLLRPARAPQHGGEGGRVVGVVAGHGQRAQTVDGGSVGAEGRVDLGEVAQRRSVGRYPAHGGAEPDTGCVEVTPAVPHQAAPKVEVGDRERRDTPVAAPRLGEQPFRLGDQSALGLEHGQGTQRREVGPALHCGSTQHQGLGVAADGLEDRRPFGVQGGPVGPAPPCCVKVGESLGEAVQGGPRPRPGQPGCAVVRRVPHQCLGQPRGALVVGDPTQDLPA